MKPIMNAAKVGSTKIGEYFFIDFIVCSLPLEETGGPSREPPAISLSKLYARPMKSAVSIASAAQQGKAVCEQTEKCGEKKAAGGKTGWMDTASE